MEQIMRRVQVLFSPDFIVTDGRSTIGVLDAGVDCWGRQWVQDSRGHRFRPARRDLFAPEDRQRIRRRRQKAF